ncbi:uncharacterized protein TM35_000381790 [Trypanosoma theileri]|uniref:Uncharacterized protein n=1 Tax=Trypanosoma theileri TaxID=67003 RepID=A0A1X0NK12_9TRYP|nr:uncharacterized protein TM35_000381790 [Trypanosoma theileri]ORC85104.1 hypothetical protein TM35_000381790 [Trypanosoma theileri]
MGAFTPHMIPQAEVRAVHLALHGFKIRLIDWPLGYSHRKHNDNVHYAKRKHAFTAVGGESQDRRVRARTEYEFLAVASHRRALLRTGYLDFKLQQYGSV